jgi:hypothetical protein
MKISKKILKQIIKEEYNLLKETNKKGSSGSSYSDTLRIMQGLDRYFKKHGIWDNFSVRAHMTNNSHIGKNILTKGLKFRSGVNETSYHMYSFAKYFEDMYKQNFPFGAHVQADTFVVMIAPMQLFASRQQSHSGWTDMITGMGVESEARNPNVNIVPQCMCFLAFDVPNNTCYTNPNALSWVPKVLNGDDKAIYDAYWWSENKKTNQPLYIQKY